MNDKVSVIIPVYNAETYLKECLQSIVNQTYYNIEVLMIDDGSTDQSKKIMKHFQEKYHFRYIYQDNQGVSSARNTGLESAKGDYIMFVDADDKINPNYIKTYMEKAILTNADIVCGGYCVDNEKINNYYREDNDRKTFVENVLQGTCGVVWAKIYKMECIDSIRFIKDYSNREDLLFNISLYDNIHKVTYINNYDYIYTFKDYGLSKQKTIDITMPITEDIIKKCNYIKCNEEILSKFVKNLVYWDIIYIVEQKKSFSLLWENKYFQKNKNLIKIKTIKDIFLFLSIKYNKKYITYIIWNIMIKLV